MITTIFAIIITLLPGMLFAYAEAKEEKKKRIEEEMIKRARSKISLNAIEARFPFISLVEYYYLKRHFYPYFAKTGLSDNDAWQLRKELFREIKKRIGGK